MYRSVYAKPSGIFPRASGAAVGLEYFLVTPDERMSGMADSCPGGAGRL
jgi:hypothetical protein